MQGSVRIISGKWRGRKIPVPARAELRPSGDRVRETLFNWLQWELAGARCLDLFAGTGALGLEAASRGAARVVLVERDHLLIEHLRGLARDWPGGEVLEPVHSDVLRWLERAAGPFDVVFIDPPFDRELEQPVLDTLAGSELLSPGACIYVEQALRSAPLELPAGWQLRREKRAGEVRMSLLARVDETGG